MDVQIVGPSNDLTILARQEHQRQEQLKEALEWLTSTGAVMENGHFVFGWGREAIHGSVYVNPRRLFNLGFGGKFPAQALVEVIPSEIRAQVEIVAGLPTCGIIVARDLADFISTKRKKNEPNVQVLFMGKDEEGLYDVHHSDAERLQDTRVLLVDDVRHRGQAFASAATSLRRCGAKLIATAEIVDRGENVIPLDVPNFFVAQLQRNILFKSSDCAMCEAGIPITKF